MPSYEEAEKSIGAQFEANWTFTPVAYENVAALDYSDTDRPSLSEGESDFIKVSVLYNNSLAADVGMDPLKRTWGNLAVDFYTKNDQGTIASKINLDRLSAIFEWRVIDDITFKDLDVLRPVSSGGWYIIPSMLRFYFNR